MATDTSIFQGVVECEHGGESLRFCREGGGRWGVYVRSCGAYIREATVMISRNCRRRLVDQLCDALYDVRADCEGLF